MAIRYVYTALGVLFLAMGVVGTVVPLLPTTPAVVFAAFCFGKSSKRLNSWFLSTRLYRKSIDGFVKKRTMTLKAKLILLSSVTFFMGLSFITMLVFQVPLFPKILLGAIWLCHVIYFGFKVKTLRS